MLLKENSSCYNEPKLWNTYEFIKESTRIHNGVYNYDPTIFVAMHRKVVIVCPEHGSFEQTPRAHLKGRGCPLCRRKRQGKSKENYSKNIEDKIKKVHGEGFDIDNPISGNRQKPVTITCKKCKTEISVLQGTLLGGVKPNRCPVCSRFKKKDLIMNKQVEFAKEHPDVIFRLFKVKITVENNTFYYIRISRAKKYYVKAKLKLEIKKKNVVINGRVKIEYVKIIEAKGEKEVKKLYELDMRYHKMFLKYAVKSKYKFNGYSYVYLKG